MQLKHHIFAVGLAAAMPAPQGSTDMIAGIQLFDNVNYGGTTTSDPVPEGQCYVVPSQLQNKISSFKLPANIGCTFWTTNNCAIPDGAFKDWYNVWIQESVPNLKKDQGSAFQDSINSFLCWHVKS